MNDNDKNTFLKWLASACERQNLGGYELEPLPGDAGFRRYFRLSGQNLQAQTPMLAVYAPPATEKNTEFAAIARAWSQLGVRTPTVYELDLERGFMLIEDFGCRALADALAEAKGMPRSMQAVEATYAPVFEQLLKLQSAHPKADLPSYSLPTYDKNALMAEMELFEPWFVEQLLGYTLKEHERKCLTAAFTWLAEQATTQPFVYVHRDFHCRNIHFAARQHRANPSAVGVIDFQDALIGPVTYDLVSLLKDCYQHWPMYWVEQQVLAYRRRLPKPLQMADDKAFLRAFELMGLQRHLKVLGIFARLHLRDGKPQYLEDLPLVVAYVRPILAKYEELAELSCWFEQILMPLIKHQAWFCSVEIKP